MRNLSLLSVLAICCTAWAQAPLATHSVGKIIEDAAYRDDAAARTAWKAMEGSPAVSVAQVEGRSAVKFPCNF